MGANKKGVGEPAWQRKRPNRALPMPYVCPARMAVGTRKGLRQQSRRRRCEESKSPESLARCATLNGGHPDHPEASK